jgi:RND family efflux transporter MFP subunit
MTGNRKKQGLSILAFVGLGLIMAQFLGVFGDKITPTILDRDMPSSDPPSITLEAREFVVLEKIPGTIRAREATIVSSRLLAGIETVHVRAGDQVEAGQLLVELENDDLQARLAMWQQQVQSYDVRLAQVRPQYERIKQLFDEGVSSQADLDRATADYQSLLAQLASVTASMQEAQTALNFSQITAPISGRVVDRLAEPGALATPGMGLVSIYNPGTLRIEGNVRESLALGLSLGQPLQAEVPSAGGNIAAIIEEIVPEAHVGTRSFLIKASIASNPLLVPGLFARLHIPVGIEQRIFVSQDYIREMGQLNIVWVQTAGGARKQIVRFGPLDASNNRAVISGLQAGDILVHPDWPQP